MCDMYSKGPRSIKMAKSVLFSLLMVSIFVPIHSARADIAPPPAPELGGLQPFDYQDTNVQMVYERVEMEVQPLQSEEASYLLSRIVVTAYFTMRNLGDSPESMQAIFPLESFSGCIGQDERSNSYVEYSIKEETFTVVIDGVDVPIEKVSTDHPYKNAGGISNQCDEMTWAGFDASFPADEDVVIRVQYVMDAASGDSMQNIEYILETGAGWAGPIERGYVIVKFPYSATTENVLPESTPGYQFLYNEVFWSFENLEPIRGDNIQVSIVSPAAWQKIVSLRRGIKEDPRSPQNWLDLADTYFDIATWHWDNIRSNAYLQKIPFVYQAGIATNPNNAELLASYAEFRLYQLSPRLIRQLTEEEAAPILDLLNRAMALEPKNELVQMILSDFLSVAPSVTFTPPATIPPTATPRFTRTPTKTSTPSKTSTSTVTPVVVTVVHTKIVQVPAATSTPGIVETNTVAATSTSAVVTEQDSTSSLSIAIIGMVATFIAGLTVSALWSNRTKS